jgi:SAM-dependent methyltransferase
MQYYLPSAFEEIVDSITQLLADFQATAHADATQAYLSLTDAYTPLRDRAGALARDLLPLEADQAKRLVQNTITPLVMGAPMPRRAYTKPRGYAGDYLMMMDIYRDANDGAGLAQQALHRMFCNHPLSQGVVTRKDYVVRKLIETKPTRITSIGCGPAVEVAEVSRYLPRAQWTLVDQDVDALLQAEVGNLERKVRCRQVDMRALVRGEESIEGRQDFIYCVGLYDYLRFDTAIRVTQSLFNALAPGGTLLIANAAGPKDYYFDPEYVLDWPLIYRTEEDMEFLGRTVRERNALWVEAEPLGAYWFLELKKR